MSLSPDDLLDEIHELEEEIAAAKTLLAKYISHVGNCEGVSFIADHHRKCSEEGFGGFEVVFTNEEWAELLRLEATDPNNGTSR